MDESILADQHVSKNAWQLIHSIDSVHTLSVGKGQEQSQQIIESKFLGRDQHTVEYNTKMQEDYATFRQEAAEDNPNWLEQYNADSLFASFTEAKKEKALSVALE